jgi:hypothetical protein
MAPQEAGTTYSENETPYTAHGYLELRGEGWERLGDALKASHGNALFLVHPWYWYEDTKRAFEAQRLHAEEEAHLVRAERYFDRIASYSRRIVSSVDKARARGLPVILLLEALHTSDVPSWLRTQSRVKEVVHRTHATFQKQGLEGEGELFFIPTKDDQAVPLQSNAQQERQSTYAQLLEQGVAFVVVGGGYFGGDGYGEVFKKQNWEDRVAKHFQKERYYKNITTPHLLEHVKASGCVAGAMADLSQAGIRFRIGRGLTYPQQIPLHSELLEEKDEYDNRMNLRWTKGFPW